MQILAVFLTLLVIQSVHSKPSPATERCPKIELTRPKVGELQIWNHSLGLKLHRLKSYHVLVTRGTSLQSLLKQLMATHFTFCPAFGSGSGRRRPAAALQDLELHLDDISRIKGASSLYVDGHKPLLFLLSVDDMKTLTVYKSLLLKVLCRRASHKCYNVSIQDLVVDSKKQTSHGLSRRSAFDVQRRGGAPLKLPDQDQNPLGHGVRDVLVGVAVCVIGLLIMIVLLAMCGGGADAYNPGQGKGSSKRMSANDEVAAPTTQEVSSPPAEDTPVTKDLKTNGTASTTAAADGDQDLPKTHESTTNRQSAASLGDTTERGRALSARSFDPLPDVPTEATKTKKEREEKKKEEASTKEEEEEEDDNPYDRVHGDDAYMEVPGENAERMASSDSDDDDKGSKKSDNSPVTRAKGQLPPYTKVSRPADKVRSKVDDEDSDSYAEVRDVVRRGPRDRSHTEPIDPEKVGTPRDKRAMTDSSAAHLPLPEIPGGRPPLIIEENVMYDSIPESQGVKTTSFAQNSPQKKKKERLYESVDEMGEKDLYESVPDDFTVKLDSPASPKSVSTPTTVISPTRAPNPPVPLNPLIPLNPPMPPSSPIPSATKHDTAKKKNLDKTTSVPHVEEKRRFSFFGRKKTTSVSSANPKKSDQVESPTSAQPPSNSPQHKSPPPLPSIPVPPRPDEDDDEEDTYDKVSPSLRVSDDIFHSGMTDDVKSKSSSLPMAYRSGARPNVPLPRVPEDSGTGIISHQRSLEMGDDASIKYDTVHISPGHEPDEPNYDTVNTEDILLAVKKEDMLDPPYDKIDKREIEALQEKDKGEREDERKSTSAEPEESKFIGRYSKIEVISPEREVESGAPPPDHDEEGYAVIPEEVRMRKRAMSASQGTQDRDLSPESVAAGYRLIKLEDCEDTIRESRSKSMSSSPQKRVGSGKSSRGSVEEQYATVDMSAKRDRKRRELEEALQAQAELRDYKEELRSVSPAPPPIPPALNPEDIEAEESPSHSEGMHQLASDGSKLESVDPPYAKVKSKKDNPYAEVSRPYAEVDVGSIQSRERPSNRRSGGASETTTLELSENTMDEAAGYDVVGVKPKSTQKEEVKGHEEASGKKDKPYDTIDGVKDNMTRLSGGFKQGLPMLETADSAGANIYDALLPVQTEGPVPSPPDQVDNEETRYEVIDERMRKASFPRSLV